MCFKFFTCWKLYLKLFLNKKEKHFLIKFPIFKVYLYTYQSRDYCVSFLTHKIFLIGISCPHHNRWALVSNECTLRIYFQWLTPNTKNTACHFWHTASRYSLFTFNILSCVSKLTHRVRHNFIWLFYNHQLISQDI